MIQHCSNSCSDNREGSGSGFLAIEKYLLNKRGLFPNTLRIQPNAWEMDAETRLEVDRLFARFQAVVGAGA